MLFNPLFMGMGGKPNLVLSSTGSQNASTTYTFAAQGLGRSQTKRVIAISVEGMASHRTVLSISSATINGVSATVAISAYQQFIDSIQRGTISAIIYAVVPTGTSGDVVITFNAAMTTVGIQVFSLYNLSSSTPFHTASNVQGNSSFSSMALNIPAFGAAIGAYSYSDWSFSSGSGLTWTSFGSYRAYGYGNQMAAETGRTIAVSATSATSTAMVGASWK